MKSYKIFIIICSVLIIPIITEAETWQRVLPAYVDNIYLAGAYSGSVNYSKPFWVDIDGDSDYDLFIGGEHGGMHFYRNIGTPSSPSWLFVTEFYKNIDVENRSSEAFVDIDADGDYDLFIGEQDGNINFYRNVGTATNDSLVLVTENFGGIDVGSFSAPYFCDIDNDNDYDLFIGCQVGTIYYYRNDGSATTPNFIYVTDSWFSIDIGTRSIPCFVDINADGDYDLFIGWAEGTVYYYRNDGTPTTPNMVYVTDNYTSDVGNTSAPSFVDIDNDNDFDLFIGEYIGNVNFYRNTGTPTNAIMTFVRRHYVDIDMNSSSTPVFVDIDADGDYDLFAGEWVGIIDFYENTGTADNHRWTIVSENYGDIDVGDNSAPTFVDIDNDNDFDMFIGNLLGTIRYYRNDGSATTPNFTLVSSNYNSIDVGDRSAPDFVDIDNDNDFDFFIGNNDGTIWFYRNTGTPSVPAWTLVSNNYNGIDVGERSIPIFADMDNDNDFDLFIGEYYGTIFYYRNDGSASVPNWTFVTNTFAGINVEENTAPTFVDIDNDGDEDLFIGERWGGLNLYLQIVGDIIPPKPPFITGVEKTGNNIKLTWNRVTQDTLNNPENVHHYVVYRNTTPDFVPAVSDSIGYVNSPDTIYTNLNAHNAPQSYYYLIKAVDNSGNKSYPSNMGFKFNKFLNHNPATTDMNWVSLPFLNTYTTAASISSELSPNGTSLNQITNLRNDQYYEDWFYVEGIGWMGNDFVINKGSGYEFVVLKDTTPVITGAHDPNFRVPLIENPAATDMNWVSVPYNAVYGEVSDITTEFSPAGNPLLQVTRLRSDQYYEDWFYVEGLGWMGEDFAIERGCAYEYVVNVDTSWKPTVYSNRGSVVAKRNKGIKEMKINHYREPAWSAGEIAKIQSTRDVMFEIELVKEENRVRQPHLVIGLFDINSLQINSQDITFTAYCMRHPEKALFEGSAGCGYEIRKNNAVVWAQFGNLPFIWQPEEEALIICEAKSGDVNYFGVKRFKLNPKENPQYVGEIKLVPVPEIEVIKDGSFYKLHWSTLEGIPIIGYSVYQNKERLNSAILSEEHFITSVAGKYVLKPVFYGGYETMLSSERIMADAGTGIEPKVFSLESAMPNPFKDYVQIRYALPVTSQVSLKLYDVTGRQIKDLVNRVEQAGYYAVKWDGRDDTGREVSAGVYLVCFKTEKFKAYKKLLLVK